MPRQPIFLLFLDGVGLGRPDPLVNPFAAADLPHIASLLEGRRLDLDLEPFDGTRAYFRSVDATLGVAGDPESATGQSVLLTGVNVPKLIGTHYGPKPDERIRAILRKYNLLRRLAASGFSSRLLNAYPGSYFDAIRSGHRLYSAIPLAFEQAGIPLATEQDLIRGEAISADFTGRGWRTRLRITDTPVLTPHQAGKRMTELALRNDFTVVDHWPTDYAGHFGEMRGAVRMLETLDRVLGGMTDAMAGTELTVVVTSDHGNLEDLSVRGHTRNPVPALLLGPPEIRKIIADRMTDLTGFATAVAELFHLPAIPETEISPEDPRGDPAAPVDSG
jgi:2,3-bisphosphoglycerate-independent phosphoglycerate mutase